MNPSPAEDSMADGYALVTAYYNEGTTLPPLAKKPRFRGGDLAVPSSVTPLAITDQLRQMQLGTEGNVNGMPTKLALNENSEIEIVKKDSVFSDKLTDGDLDTIQQRVARQQRQFAEYENREKLRKFEKVYAIYDYLTIEEMEESLQDCNGNEDEIIVRLTRHAYLLQIRKKVASKYAPEVENKINMMTPEQLAAYEQLMKKRAKTLKKTTDDATKKQYRLGGRLALDDALKQVEQNGVDPNKAFEGWSSARIRAYNMIEQNPNSYYYRFNAPGEIQQKGQWAPDERKRFFDRLEEVGANGQWGLFAMTIPGRVGYQCSNFYRLLVETGQVDDPNYVLDSKGKAHYLFDKKNANGTVEKTFRTHNKQAGTGRPTTELPPLPDGSSPTAAATATRRRAADKKGTKRKRRTRGWNSDDDDDDDNDDLDDDDDIMTMFDDPYDTSGAYNSSTRSTSSGRRTRSRLESPVEEEAPKSASPLSSSPTEAAQQQPEEEDDEEGGAGNNDDDEELDELDSSSEESDDEESEFTVNPLPGFIDPITLDEVRKPAISKYGHVMGYNSWIRCLTNWEGKRNICPLTKKPLTKRDLVILTVDNIEEYRNQIHNV